MKSFLVSGVMLAGFGMLAGCGSSSSDDAAGPVTIELATWWTGDTEHAAITALLDEHKKVHPEVKINLLAAADSDSLKTTVNDRLSKGNPPAAFQANLGGSALAWGPNAQSLSAVSGPWASNFQPSVLDQLTYNNELIGVPVALTRQNVAYWNLKVLNTLTTLTNKIPATTADFTTWLTEVSAAGYTHPLCFGAKASWVASHVMFEDILPAVAGRDFSTAYWTGKADPNDPKVQAAFDFAKTLIPYLSVDWADMDMGAGIDKVMATETNIENQCLMTAMGDWGGGQLAAKFTPDADFTGTGYPGASKLVVFGGDTFVAAKGAANQQAVFDFFATMASKAGQVAFDKIKGSMPARTLDAADLSADSGFSVLTANNAKDLAGTAENAPVPGFKVMGASAYPFDPLGDKVVDFLKTGDPAAIMQSLKDNYSLLK